MKAVVWTKYGPPDVLQLQEIPKPVPKDDEILIKIYASTVTAGDCEMRTLNLPLMLGYPTRLYIGITKPQKVTILGQELAGEIEAVGKDVKRFKVGDQVFGSPGFSFGGYAEYKCMPAEPDDGILALKPTNMSFEEAAAVTIGGLESLHFLKKSEIHSGDKVLINGAGGSIGTIGIQLAKYYGAEVTAVDSTGKLDMLRSIGADHVVDYTQEDFTKSGVMYDVIFDVIGKAPFSGSMNSLKPNGSFLLANPNLTSLIRGQMTSGKKVFAGTSSYNMEDLEHLKDLIEAGKLKTVIDRRFPLDQTADAHRYVETGQKKGNVIITVVS